MQAISAECDQYEHTECKMHDHCSCNCHKRVELYTQAQLDEAVRAELQSIRGVAKDIKPYGDLLPDEYYFKIGYELCQRLTTQSKPTESE